MNRGSSVVCFVRNRFGFCVSLLDMFRLHTIVNGCKAIRMDFKKNSFAAMMWRVLLIIKVSGCVEMHAYK